MHLITVIDHARGGWGEYDLTLGAFTPYLQGANPGKAFTRLFTPPGTGNTEAAQRAASTPPAIAAPGTPGGTPAGTHQTAVAGYAPWIGFDEIAPPSEVDVAGVSDFTGEEREAQNLTREALYRQRDDEALQRSRDIGLDQEVLYQGGMVKDAEGNWRRSDALQGQATRASDIASLAEQEAIDYLKGTATPTTGRDIGGETLTAERAGVDPATLRRQAEEKRQLTEQMTKQIGPDWRNSTIGVQAWNALQQRHGEEQFQQGEARLQSRTAVGTQARQNFQGGADWLRNLTSYSPYAQAEGMRGRGVAMASEYQKPFMEHRALSADQAVKRAQILAQQRVANYQTQVGQRTDLGKLLADQRNTDESNRFGVQRQALDANRHLYQTRNQNMLLAGAGAGQALFALSDERLKTDIKPLFKRKGVTIATYRWKDDPTGTPQIGVIAQDVQKKHPEAVVERDDGALMVGVEALRHALR